MVILSSTSRSHPALMPPLSKGLYYYSGLVQGKHRCAHGEYSEYPASTLVPRPDYWAQAEVESTVGYSIHLLVGFHGRGDPPWGARSDTR